MKLSILPLVISYALLILWGVFLSVLYRKGFLTRENFQKKPVFISYGLLAYPACLTGMIVLYAASNTDIHSLLNYAVILSLVWIGGALDDLFGSGNARGFRGHIGALVREKRITTGLVKILFGLLAGAAAAYYFNSASMVKGVVAFLLIPLSANTVNLLDLRPGRAFAAFAVCALVVLIACSFRIYDWNICGIIFAVTCIAYYWDRKGDAMMGDAWSNVLGAFLGILVIMNMPLWFGIVCVILNIALQIYSETHSITRLIEKHHFLRIIDSLTGIR